ncbi:hypothetical protein HJC23_001656 [Cyclotella cryptica]|uniref:Uncharacterized protein n=1 Tax=Cyclotella cryptica TaxID=29204 RepID=A0ABD3QLF3_9STRA
MVDLLRWDSSQLGVDGSMVFLNTVKDVDGATNGLRRAGINAVPCHAQVPLEERAYNHDKFLWYHVPSNNNDCSKNDKETVPVLVCTDLASLFTGCAGNSDGRGIIFYGPTEKELVDVVREAEEQQSCMMLSQDVDDGMDVDVVDSEGQGDAGKVKRHLSNISFELAGCKYSCGTSTCIKNFAR